MNFFDLQPSFKKYILLEKGITVPVYKAIVSTMNMLRVFAHTDQLISFDEGMIRAFLYDGRQSRLWSPKTFRNHWQNIKTFFDWCVKQKFVKSNPVVSIERPKLSKHLPRCLSRQDTFKILYHVASYKWVYQLEQSRNEAIVTTLLFTGLRLQELLNLQVMDVNLISGNIFVRQGKGSKDRIVPIHPQLLPKLRAYFTARQGALSPSQWFFTGVKSVKKLNQKDVRHICQKVSVVSGVKFTPHMLRHTFGKLMVEADYSIYKLKEIMGHAQVTTTQLYVSVAPESIKRSFDKVRII